MEQSQTASATLDGAGGGGAGGTIVLTANKFFSTLILSAKGGNGGNVNVADSNCYGPGGGGGGGTIYLPKGVNTSALACKLSGGVAGINSNSFFSLLQINSGVQIVEEWEPLLLDLQHLMTPHLLSRLVQKLLPKAYRYAQEIQ